MKKVVPISSRFQVIEAWEQEYSFQLAITLYVTATNSDKHSKFGHFVFDFNPDKFEFFKTDEGKRLRSVIERLSNPDPKFRMHHKDAADLLKVLDNKDNAYDKINAKLVDREDLRAKMRGRVEEVYEASSYIVNARQILKAGETEPEQTKAKWEKQLAASLYVAYTAPPPFLELNVPLRNPSTVSFDFNHRSFEGENGSRLKSIIERLNDSDPQKHLDYKDAARLLEVIDNKVLYEKTDNEIRVNRERRDSRVIQHERKGSTTHMLSTLAKENRDSRKQTVGPSHKGDLGEAVGPPGKVPVVEQKLEQAAPTNPQPQAAAPAKSTSVAEPQGKETVSSLRIK
jgi:hypothetical protein